MPSSMSLDRYKAQVRKAHSFLIAAMALCIGANAAFGADLLTLYREALSTDALYSKAQAQYTADQEKIPQARAGLLPAVTLSGNTQYNDRDLTFRTAPINNSNGRYNTNSFNITATQPLFRFQNWVSYEQAKNEVSQAEAAFLQAQHDLILRVAQAYFDVLLAGYTVDLAKAQIAAYGQQLAQAKRNFEIGTATITDANDAQARYDLAISQEIAAENDLQVKKEGVRQITGRPAPDLAKLSTRFARTSPNPNNIDDWVNQANQSSAQVRVAQAALEVAMQDIDKNRAGHLPTLDAVISYVDAGAESGIEGGSGTDSTTKFIGLQLAVPIYLGGSINSRVRESIANRDKARDDLENVKRTVALNTRTGFLGVTSGMAQIRALQTALASSQSSVDSSIRGQEVGVRTQVDVLNATQQLISTRRDYAQAIYGYTLSVLKLKAAAGTLNVDDVAYVNEWLEK